MPTTLLHAAGIPPPGKLAGLATPTHPSFPSALHALPHHVSTKTRIPPVQQDIRRSYRELYYTAPGMGQYISGVIMFKETLYQKTKDGRPFVEVLAEQGILAGIKVDEVRACRTSRTSSWSCTELYGRRCRAAGLPPCMGAGFRGRGPVAPQAHAQAAFAVALECHGMACGHERGSPSRPLGEALTHPIWVPARKAQRARRR